MTSHTFSAVLFDVDGVLLDSAPAYRAVWDTWSLSRGLDPDVVWPLTYGRRPKDTVRDVAPELDPAVEYAELLRLLGEDRTGFPAFPGAAGLLGSLDRWAIVTSGRRDAVHERFALAGLPLPEVQVCEHDVALGKPAPDGYLLAAARLGVDPAACLVVEDAPAGVLAGKAAGCTVLALTTGLPAEALPGADHYAPDLTAVTDLLS
ncbi:HAD-IA family hydrolase [Kitasatospora sp. NPDC002227]|uniref:HAD-IA family hydrolase n=1 Tax=Kitasatospora sp. NPDC002227 TaxID=3154773 RepID=UPI00332FA68D